MTLPLPSYVKTGLVAGKSIVVDVDTPTDPDLEPDATYPTGSTLLFTPSVDYLVFGPDHATTYLQPITATINSSGDPTTPTGDPLRLVANIGQTDTDQDWYWSVRPKINGKTQTTFRLDVTAGATSYLSDAQPIPATTPSSVVVRGPAGAGAPPAGTPDGYVATSASSAAAWKAPAAAGLASSSAVGTLSTEGLALWGYGNSYLANTGNAFMTFFDRVRRRGRFGSWWNAGVSGYLMPDICQRAYGTFTAPSQGSLDLAPSAPPSIAGTWAAAALKGGVVLLEPFRNDASFDGIATAGSTTAKARAAATQALKAFVCLMRAQSRIEDEDASNTYTGAWATIGALTNVSNTAVHYTSTVGAKVSRTLTVPASGEVDVVMLAIDDFAMTSSGGQGGAPYKITCTGKADILGTTSNQHRITGHGPNSNYSTMVERITGLAPGATVTVTLEKSGAADGTILWFDGFLLASPTPPTVAILKPGTLTAAQYATIQAGGGTGASAATDAVYAGIVDTVVAQFPTDQSVLALDPNAAGFNAATMISNADGLNVHLNDLGNACYADLILGALNGLQSRPGLQATGTATPATLPDVQRVASAEKGAASGVATLDASGLVPLAQLPTGQKAKGFTAPSTFWQLPCNQMGAGTSTAVTSGNLTFVPIDVGPGSTGYAALGVGVGTAQVAGTTTTTLAVYPDDGTGARPQCAGGPIASGAVTLTATGNRTVAISATLAPGRYWLAFLYVATVAPTTVPSVYMLANAVTGPIASSSVIGNIVGRGWLLTGQAAMPTTDVRASMTSIGGTQAPVVGIQAA